MSDVKTIKQGFIRSAVFMGLVGVILAIGGRNLCATCLSESARAAGGLRELART